MKILSYRTTMPFDNRARDGDAFLSPSTQKSVMPFYNVHTIQDVLDGRKYDSLHGGGDWSSGEDVDKSYREKGDDYKRREQDMERWRRDEEILGRLLDNGKKISEKWVIKVPGGSKIFISFDLAEAYLRKYKIPFTYLSRIAQKENKENKEINQLTDVAEQDKLEIIADSLNKCFMVESINPKAGVKETGSAFCVKKDYFITCAHVIKNYNRVDKLSSDGFGDGIFINLVQNGKWYRAELIAVDLMLDIALIRCGGINIEPFELSASVAIGDDVIAIGSPHGYENNVSTGTVGSLGRKPFPNEGFPEYMFVDLSVFPGNSGGPVIKEKTGEVVGLVSLIISGGTDYGLNAALPSSYIKEFLQKSL